jgi:hypothetical protein
VAILNIGSRDERGSGGGSEFRFCNQCMNEVSDTITAGVIDLRLPWRVIGYTAEECERDMRKMSNGERGCANPAEHEFVKDPHMKPRGL